MTNEQAPLNPEKRYGVLYPWFVVFLLLTAYTLSFIDRQIISLLVDPIRQDLDISDTQISLLQGLAFAIFYTVMGIPIAKAADRRSRVTIIAAGITVWSVMTAFCGIAKNYWTLFLGRLGVGVGEAALSPASYSMISDYFLERRLSTALAVYGAGPYIGAGLAYILGGLTVAYLNSLGDIIIPVLGHLSSWQAAFIVVGLPGLGLALVLYLLVREPVRRARPSDQSADTKFLSDVLPYIWKNRDFYVSHAFGMGFVSLVAYASFSWLPSFFVRVHGWQIGEVAQSIGWIVLVGGTLGVFLGGRFADFLSARGYRDATMRTVFIGSLLIAPASGMATMVGSASLSLALVGLVFFAVAFPFGAGVAALQIATPSHYRAQASAVYLFVNNLIGLAAGPTAVALLTDYAFKDDAAVGNSLAIVGIAGGIIATICCYLSLKPLRRLVEQHHE